MKYEKPQVKDFGSIAGHTFNTPGVGDKSDYTDYETDNFLEYSHPAGS